MSLVSLVSARVHIALSVFPKEKDFGVSEMEGEGMSCIIPCGAVGAGVVLLC